MSAKWEKTEANVGVLEVELSSEQFTEALDWAFRKVVKGVAMPGFRKGKVPRKIFESRYGVESLYQDAIDFLLPKAYQDAINETGIEPVDRPTVDVVQVEVGKPFVFKATVTVRPEVVLGEYKGLEVSDQSIDVEEDDLTNELEQVRANHAEINVVEDGTVENGDNVSIDFVGRVDGEVFEGGEAENYQLEIGSGTFIKGFEEQLLGMKPGEERDIDVVFPEEYHVKALANANATFHVVLHDIKRKFLRELNDEFVQEISEFETVADFTEELKKQVASRKEAERRNHLEQSAVDAAVDNATIDIPVAMVDHEIDHQVQNFAQQLQMQQIPLDAYLEFTGISQEELREQFREAAERNVRVGLVLEGIAKAEGLDSTEDELNAELQKLSEASGLDVDRVRQMLTLRDADLSNMKAEIRTRKTVEFLVEHSKIV